MVAPTATAAPHPFPDAGPGSIDDRKRALRRAMRGRGGDPGALRARLGACLVGIGPGVTIGAVWPLGDEPDLRPLLHRLATAGCAIALPVVVGAGTPLVFRAWQPGDRLEAGPFGTFHPSPEAAERPPALILVPVLAFDRARRRLGRGGGFYDRTLAARPDARAIGFGYASREIEAVPVAGHDRALDAIATDREMIE